MLKLDQFRMFLDKFGWQNQGSLVFLKDFSLLDDYCYCRMRLLIKSN